MKEMLSPPYIELFLKIGVLSLLYQIVIELKTIRERAEKLHADLDDVLHFDEARKRHIENRITQRY